jgi:HAD superfamily hydrolase (TIGR01509 family)
MQVVLWDLDGTLADTEELHFAAWQMTMNERGIAYSYATFIESFGRRNADILPELLGHATPPAVIEAVSAAKETRFRELLRHKGLKPMPGVVDWLERFYQAGLRQVISSSAPMANIVATLDVLRLGDFFASLMAGARLPQGKPHPAIFLNSAAAVNAAPADCLVLEDSLAGIAAARRGGMTSVAVGKVIDLPAFQAMLATQTGPTCVQIHSLEQLAWDHLPMVTNRQFI